MVVWKYTFTEKDIVAGHGRVKKQIPVWAKFLKVDNQDGDLTLWALVRSTEETHEKTFTIAGTGHKIVMGTDEILDYVGSALFRDGRLVLHLFEVAPL